MPAVVAARMDALAPALQRPPQGPVDSAAEDSELRLPEAAAMAAALDQQSYRAELTVAMDAAARLGRGAEAEEVALWAEVGGPGVSGAASVTDSFADSFWWLTALGKLAGAGYGAVCRQTLAGGHYALLGPSLEKNGAGTSTEGLWANPDYLATLLHRRLVGRRALSVKLVAPDAPYLSAFASCTPRCAGGAAGACNASAPNGSLTLLLVNADASRKDQLAYAGAVSFDGLLPGGRLSHLARYQWRVEALELLAPTQHPKIGWRMRLKQLQLNGEHYFPAHGTSKSDGHDWLDAVRHNWTADPGAGAGPADMYGRSYDVFLDCAAEPLPAACRSPLVLGPMSYAFLVFPAANVAACGGSVRPRARPTVAALR
jgi:hypothetical protein